MTKEFKISTENRGNPIAPPDQIHRKGTNIHSELPPQKDRGGYLFWLSVFILQFEFRTMLQNPQENLSYNFLSAGMCKKCWIFKQEICQKMHFS